MPQKFLETFDSFFPVREESQTNNQAIWLDRLIYFFILVTALAAPISIAATNVGWLSGLFFWFIRAFVRPHPRLFKTSVDLPIFGLFAWSLLSCIFSYAPDLSFDRFRVLTLFPIAYLVSQNIRNRKTVKFLAGALIFSCMVTVLWTFAERAIGRGVQVYGVQTNSALARVGLKDGDTLLRINGKRFREPEELIRALERNETIQLNMYRPDFYYDVELRREFLLNGETANEKLGIEKWKRGRNWRSAGFYDHYTTYAEVLQLITSLVLGVFIASLKKQEKEKISSQPIPFLPFSLSPFLPLVCLALMSAALLLTATRASQAAFLLSGLTIVALGASRKVLIGTLAVFLPLVIIAGIYLQQSRNVDFVDTTDKSTLWRITVWREGFELLTKSPRHLLVGTGIDSVKRFKCEWGLFGNCTLKPGHFHSTPLQIAVECGLPALFLWLFTVFRYGQSLIQAAKNEMGAIEKGILLGAFGGLVGFFASGLVHYNLGDSEVAMVFYFIMGLNLVLTRKTAEAYNSIVT